MLSLQWQLYLLCTSPNSLGLAGCIRVRDHSGRDWQHVCSCACVIPIKFILLFRSGRLQPQLRMILLVNLPLLLLPTSWFQNPSISAHKLGWLQNFRGIQQSCRSWVPSDNLHCVTSKLQASFACVTPFCKPQFRLWLLCMHNSFSEDWRIIEIV